MPYLLFLKNCRLLQIIGGALRVRTVSLPRDAIDWYVVCDCGLTCFLKAAKMRAKSHITKEKG